MQPKNGYWVFNDDAYPNGRYRSVGEQLWKRAGVRPADVDVVQFCEDFTGITLMAVADVGFCEPGDLNEFVTEERMMAPSGDFPFNTSGGNLAEAYTHGFELVNEAVRHVRWGSTIRCRTSISACRFPGRARRRVVRSCWVSRLK